MGSRRSGDRAADELRPVAIEIGAMKFAEGSALVALGDTKVLVSASIENRVPPFLEGSGGGWITAEYAMLPRATHTRNRREVTSGRPSGRSSEIQRLVGRSLRGVLDLSALGPRTVTVDCDVIQADGGTRTAAITGGYVAIVESLAPLLLTGEIERWPVRSQVAATSVGIVDGVPMLDLEYTEDSTAEVDMNVVGTPDGRIVEIQGTGETRSFVRSELDRLIDLALVGISRLGEVQNAALAGVLAEVEEARGSSRSRTEAKPERDLWREPS